MTANRANVPVSEEHVPDGGDVLWVSSHNELSMVFILEIMVLHVRKEEQSGFSRFQHKLDMRTKTNTDVSMFAS